MVFLLLCFVIFALWLMLVYWPTRKSTAFAKDVAGPIALPIIGNTYLFFKTRGDHCMETVKTLRKYPSPMKFWLGSIMLLCYRNPEQVEKLLSTTKLTQKHDVYDFLKPYAGDGLISGSGPNWKHARRLLQPLFNIQFVAESTKIISKHINLLLHQLDAMVNSPNYFNCEKLVHHFTADVIGETILGVQLNTMKGESADLMSSFASMYELVTHRMRSPWLHPDFLFKLSSIKKLQDKATNILQTFFKNVAETGKAACFNNVTLAVTEQNDGFRPPLIDITERIVNSKHLDDQNLIDNLFTIYAASEDTMTAITSASLLCFGMYPEYQQKAADEIRNVVGNDVNTVITFEHVVQMEYLDMCVKDVLRLFPIAPMILRKTTDTLNIDNLTIPPNCAILISIFNLHTDANEWEKPMEFYPEHFLPEAVKNRHVFSYIPFSAGPRGCIGKTFAQTIIKLLLANILRIFQIEAEGKYIDIYNKFKADISVRPTNGYPIKIRRRVWN